jgi:hypothetical protein
MTMGSYTDIYRTASNVSALNPAKKPLALKPDPYRQIADDMAAKAQTQQAIDNQPPPPPAAPQQTTSAPVPSIPRGANFLQNTTPSVGGPTLAQDPLSVAIKSQVSPEWMQASPLGGSHPDFGKGWDSTLHGMSDTGGDPWAGADAGLTPQTQPQDDWQKLLQDALAKTGDFNPTQDLMNEQRDAALRQLAESGASRGMGNSGFEDAMAGDIYRGTARDSAKAYQDFQQQEIQNQMQGAQMLMQDDWKNMDQNQQKAMAELMYRLGRQEKYGDGQYPGDAFMDAMYSMMNNPDLEGPGKKLVQQGIYDYLGYEKFYSMFHGDLNANELRDIFANDPEALAWLEKQTTNPTEYNPQPKPDGAPEDRPGDKPTKEGGQDGYNAAMDAWRKNGSVGPMPNLNDYV